MDLEDLSHLLDVIWRSAAGGELVELAVKAAFGRFCQPSLHFGNQLRSKDCIESFSAGVSNDSALIENPESLRDASWTDHILVLYFIKYFRHA